MKKTLSLLLGLLLVFSMAIVALAEGFASGDVNRDGSINAGDAALILRSIVKLNRLDAEQTTLADTNEDGTITAADAAAILRYIVKLDTLPPGRGTVTPAPTPGVPANVLAFEAEVVRLVNIERANANPSRPPLAHDPLLSAIARMKSADMCDIGYFAHVYAGSGFSYQTKLIELGVVHTAAAENIALGQTTPAVVVDSWMKSSGHRTNILNPEFRKIGVGYDPRIGNIKEGPAPWTEGEYGNFWTQIFTD